LFVVSFDRSLTHFISCTAQNVSAYIDSVGATFYCIGFASAVESTFLDVQTDELHGRDYRQMLIASITLFVVVCISLIGAGGFTKVNVPLFAIQFSTIMFGAFCMYFRQDASGLALKHGGVFKEWTWDAMVANAHAAYSVKPNRNCNNGPCDYKKVFAIIFPAVKKKIKSIFCVCTTLNWLFCGSGHWHYGRCKSQWRSCKSSKIDLERNIIGNLFMFLDLYCKDCCLSL
jgi:hypothetical protein